MLKITRGYKQGRAVICYDVFNTENNTTRERVAKDEVVKICESGEVIGAKIQWWEGKAIVRLADKNIPILRLNDNNEVVGCVPQVTRGNSNGVSKTENKNSAKPEKVVDVSSKSEVVGKLAKRPKNETIFAGYDTKNLVEQHELKASISYEKMVTLEDLFMQMTKEFNVKNTEVYRSALSKKIKLNKKISEINRTTLYSIQDAMATYLMNMANMEVRDAYNKYKVRLLA